MPVQFITAQDLTEQKDWLILDASYYLSGGAGQAEERYRQAAIPGAKFWNIDECADPFSRLPHMKAQAHRVAHFLGGAGFRGQPICVYDQQGLFSAPRLAWELSLHLQDGIYLLTGGLPSWQASGLELAGGSCVVAPAQVGKTPLPALVPQVAGAVASIADLIDATRSLGQIADARSPGRFAGTETEPRPGLRSGHIPGSVNIPYSSLIKNGAFADDFPLGGLDLRKPLITSCGSGITAAGLALALKLRGAEQVRVYDGSWAEWGDPQSLTPVATGLT